MQKSPAITDFLDHMSEQLFGRSRTESLVSKTCVSCGGPAVEFTTPLSLKEYSISGLCEVCQDKAFGASSNYVNQD